MTTNTLAEREFSHLQCTTPKTAFAIEFSNLVDLKFFILVKAYLPTDKVLDHSNLKYFADDKINVTYKINFVMGRVENIVSKGENACSQHFLLYTECFQNTSSLWSLKVGIVW